MIIPLTEMREIMRNVSDKVVEKIKTHIFWSIIFFR